MATRPVFIPHVVDESAGVRSISVAFVWQAGQSPARKRLNAAALHRAIHDSVPDLHHPLEVSSKSQERVGVALSAFNLGVTSRKSGGFVCVESLYQASKVFGNGGPFPELYPRPALEVRNRLKAFAGQPLAAFDLHGVRWPLVPPQAFYCWVYCHTLHGNPALVAALSSYDCFTDIEFNPARSVNCQAYAVALYVALKRVGRVEQALASQATFLELLSGGHASRAPKPAAVKKTQNTPAIPSGAGKAAPQRSHKRRTKPLPSESGSAAEPMQMTLLETFYPSIEPPESIWLIWPRRPSRSSGVGSSRLATRRRIR